MSVIALVIFFFTNIGKSDLVAVNGSSSTVCAEDSSLNSVYFESDIDKLVTTFTVKKNSSLPSLYPDHTRTRILSTDGQFHCHRPSVKSGSKIGKASEEKIIEEMNHRQTDTIYISDHGHPDGSFSCFGKNCQGEKIVTSAVEKSKSSKDPLKVIADYCHSGVLADDMAKKIHEQRPDFPGEGSCVLSSGSGKDLVQVKPSVADLMIERKKKGKHVSLSTLYNDAIEHEGFKSIPQLSSQSLIRVINQKTPSKKVENSTAQRTNIYCKNNTTPNQGVNISHAAYAELKLKDQKRHMQESIIDITFNNKGIKKYFKKCYGEKKTFNSFSPLKKCLKNVTKKLFLNYTKKRDEIHKKEKKEIQNIKKAIERIRKDKYLDSYTKSSNILEGLDILMKFPKEFRRQVRKDIQRPINEEETKYLQKICPNDKLTDPLYSVQLHPCKTNFLLKGSLSRYERLMRERTREKAEERASELRWFYNNTRKVSALFSRIDEMEKFLKNASFNNLTKVGKTLACENDEIN